MAIKRITEYYAPLFAAEIESQAGTEEVLWELTTTMMPPQAPGDGPTFVMVLTMVLPGALLGTQHIVMSVVPYDVRESDIPNVVHQVLEQALSARSKSLSNQLLTPQG